jgi:hypothetical protein
VERCASIATFFTRRVFLAFLQFLLFRHDAAFALALLLVFGAIVLCGMKKIAPKAREAAAALVGAHGEAPGALSGRHRGLSRGPLAIRQSMRSLFFLKLL